MPIPFLDLKPQHQALKKELLAALEQVLDSTAFAGGSFVTKFEEEFAAYCQTQHAVGVGNGTDALWFALLALGVGPGDEVITVPNTFIATAEAITYTGAEPVFVDVDEVTSTMDPKLIEQAITKMLTAIYHGRIAYPSGKKPQTQPIAPSPSTPPSSSASVAS